MFKTIICDFDGTIVDSGQVVFDLFNEFADKYDYKKIPQSESDRIRALTVKERFKEYEVPVLKVPMLTMDVVKRYKKSIPTLEVNQEMKRVLKSLKEFGIKLVMISANSKENIEKFLKLNDMEYFDEIIQSSRFFGRHTTMNNYMKKNHVAKDEIILIADEHRDIVAAKKSEIPIISVTWGYDLEELLSKSNPDFLVRSPLEIMDIIRNDTK
ncbi:HAD hydrolase-like protein [Priestia megaterium]|uniref:HAD hydrolase-like protein n=1 Tax=Priestia megaterium TaxID=1404 RepID=UPI002E23DB36|nr:HAD hydrolase-like protein [Priestia megaterium]MED4279530.1 HAD hydrolase-like protein [Priestia megaterium]MED4319498.1 HAD hydrolase-like protein [Priestia megaterium]